MITGADSLSGPTLRMLFGEENDEQTNVTDDLAYPPVNLLKTTASQSLKKLFLNSSGNHSLGPEVSET